MKQPMYHRVDHICYWEIKFPGVMWKELGPNWPPFLTYPSDWIESELEELTDATATA